jgi:hypothetical protein
MKWFYAADGQQAGPVTDEDLDELIRAGRINGDTLVWEASMPDWKPLRDLRRPVGPPVQATGSTPPGMARCAECSEVFTQREMIQIRGSWVCARCKPVFVQRLVEGVPQTRTENLWRKGKALVVPLGGALPCRCARCNQPVSRPQIRRTVYWHVPWVYLLILVSLLIYIIVALIIRKKAVVQVSLCDRHRTQRGLVIAGSWLAALAGIASFVVAGNVLEHAGLWVLVGVVLLIAGIAFGVTLGTLVRAERIDEQVVHLRGFCPAFLNGLPEWPR